jgi:hypothetical protein
MSDGITHEMIVAAQRKATLIDAVARELDRRLTVIAARPDVDCGTLLEVQAKRDSFLTTARAKPAEFFAPLADVNALLTALRPVQS